MHLHSQGVLCFDYQILGEILFLLYQAKKDHINATIAFTLPSTPVGFAWIASTRLFSAIPIPRLLEQTQECNIKEHVRCNFPTEILFSTC